MPTSADQFDLERFVAAQAAHYVAALEELRAGRKRSHWMWFIFPQYAGLGKSARSTRFAIRSRQEAELFLQHEVLGPRLHEAFAAAMSNPNRSACDIFGSPDNIKLQSCATLFDAVRPDSIFQRALIQFFDGERDPTTIALLA